MLVAFVYGRRRPSLGLSSLKWIRHPIQPGARLSTELLGAGPKLINSLTILESSALAFCLLSTLRQFFNGRESMVVPINVLKQLH